MTRRGFSTLIVLIVLTLSALVASTALTIGSARVASTHASVDSDQLRALGWSGVQAVMSELAAQREELLRGGEASVPDEIVVFETGGERGIVRLIDLDPDRDTALASEAARLHLRTATADALGGLPGMGSAWAEAIVSARSGGVLDSPEGALTLAGADAGAWYGVESDGRAFDAVAKPDEERDAAPLSAPGIGAPALRDLVTVYSHDPSVQSGFGGGFGGGGDGYAGQRCLPTNRGWSDELGAAIEERLGERWVELLRAALERDDPVDAWTRIAGLVPQDADPEEVRALYDAVRPTDAPFVPGLIDVNRAPFEVLRCVPGLGDDAASRIVEARDGLSDDTRASLSWIEDAGVTDVSEASVGELRAYLTTRSLQWRVRLEAWVERGEAEGRDPGLGAALTGGLDDAGPGVRRVVYEAVIDVATPRPRVAYLRDITHEELARALQDAASRDSEPEPDWERGMDAEMGDTSLGEGEPAGRGAPDPSRDGEADPGSSGEPVEAEAARPSFADTDPRVGRWRGGSG